MLQFSDQPYKYFPPRPNRLIAWLGEWWSRRYLLAGPEHRIQSVTVENAGRCRIFSANTARGYCCCQTTLRIAIQ